MNNIDYDKLYKFKTLALKLSQCHPDVIKDKKWMIMYAIMHGLFFAVLLTLVYNVICVDIKNGDFSNLCKDCALTVVYLEVVFNAWVFIHGENFLKYLINTMKHDLKVANSLNAERQNIVMKNALHGAWISKIWFAIAVGGSNIFVVENVITNIRSYIKGNFKLIPIFDFEYPDFINADNLVFFVLNYALFALFLAYSGIMYTSFVALGPSFILHAYGQIELLILDVENLFVEDGKDPREKIKSIVKKQQNIYRFVDSINKTFKVAYDLIIKSTVVATPISAYDVIYSLSQDVVNLESLTLLIMFVSPLISSFLCYYSELLIQQSERFRQAIYSCGWERSSDRRVRKSIALILQRALRPAAIESVFSTVCLVALSESFRQSYTLFNLMNVMWG